MARSKAARRFWIDISSITQDTPPQAGGNFSAAIEMPTLRQRIVFQDGAAPTWIIALADGAVVDRDRTTRT